METEYQTPFTEQEIDQFRDMYAQEYGMTMTAFTRKFGTSYLPERVLKWAGLKTANPILINKTDTIRQPILAWNDKSKRKFKYIADLIVRNL